MSKKDKELGKPKVIQEYRDKLSMELFGKPEYKLAYAEGAILERYVYDCLHPKWKVTRTVNDEPILICNSGKAVRDPITNKEFKIYYPDGKYPYIWMPERSKTQLAYIQHIHRLVAQAFCPNDDHLTDINHINGNKWCNWYRNLEWCTRSYNIKQAYVTGLRPKGEDHPNSIYTNKQVEDVCQLLQDHPDMKYDEIEKITGVDWKTVSAIYSKEYWLNISNKYTFPPRQTKAKGENNGSAKYTNEQAEQVCQLLDQVYLGKSSLSHRQIAEKVGVSVQMVDKINKGRQWVDIAKSHPFYKAIDNK